MRLESLRLVDFKNYESAMLRFQGSIHCLLGKNGSGKTNLLEAIYYLCFTRGPRGGSDVSCIRNGKAQFVIEGRFRKEDKPHEVVCTFSSGEKKLVSEDGKIYSKFSDHIGKYPLVLVAPNDIELIWDGPELRRRYVDTLLSQTDPEYLRQLILYQSVLRQRNGLLKMSQERGAIDRDLLHTYDTQLMTAGTYIFSARETLVKRIIPVLTSQYSFLVDGRDEQVGILYTSDLATLDFGLELSSRLERDRILGRTSVGIHRDDFNFQLMNQSLKEWGSQGQQKSFLIALKLAEFRLLEEKNRFKPLLLLDDIFDKLDDDRIHRLMDLISAGSFGQIFITDARPERSEEMLRRIGVKSQNFQVEDGKIQDRDQNTIQVI
ncbi:MAG: DNA replication and repair protein RecF [Bacteroidetes bacterium]|nr:DNA replication and repair protein RecF [Bacteroidota bacterium]